MTKVFVAVPCYDAITPQALPSIVGCVRDVEGAFKATQSSILPHTFNSLWCDCLNDGSYTHFAMHHADVEAPQGWVDSLLEEMGRVGADVLSVVIAIKDARGLTSTGVYDIELGEVRRFTLGEALALPETFSAADAGYPRWPLAINTGLWVAKLGPWVEGFPGFHVTSRVVKSADGEWLSKFVPEDWNFGRWLHARGLNVRATRALDVTHHGRAEFSNTHPWGKWPTDLTYEALKASAQAAEPRRASPPA